MLKFITCGSVDDGKSTLIGHMLYKAKLIFKDQEDALILESKIKNNGTIDYSLLLDGLIAEREQGITIDVAYRYFNTKERSFIVADTPGHEEYTRNMAVGASFANLAIILLDASNITDDILIQTKRHIRICNLMGIENYVFAINKMDLVEYSEIKFKDISVYINKFLEANNIALNNKLIIPISATKGDNIIELSENTSWYKDKALLEYLERVDIKNNKNNKNQDFLMPVQRVSRPSSYFRGFQGQVIEGSVEVGEEITILPSGEKAHIENIYILDDKKTQRAEKGQPVTIALDKEVDCSRGCVIVKNNKNNYINNTRLFKADLLWTDNSNLVVGREYLIKIGTKLVSGMIININYCVDINTGASISQKDAKKNDIINCDVSLIEKVVTSSFEDCKDLGRFVLINKLNNMTSGCGVIKHKLTRSDNLTYQNIDITREMRSNQKLQTPKTLWFTGLSGSGKSTIANELEKALFSYNKHTLILDGDNIRMGINNNLGFTEQDRVENIRRIAEVSKLLNEAGIISIVSAISPFEQDRENAKEIIGRENFIEIYVNTSLGECEKRDPKSLYKKARSGELKNFTGISSRYDEPRSPDFVAETEKFSVEQIVEQLIEYIINKI